MHDLSTMCRMNDEAAKHELEQQERLITRLEARLRHRGVEIELGTTIQSATDAVCCQLEARPVKNRNRVPLRT